MSKQTRRTPGTPGNNPEEITDGINVDTAGDLEHKLEAQAEQIQELQDKIKNIEAGKDKPKRHVAPKKNHICIENIREKIQETGHTPEVQEKILKKLS